MPTFRRQHTIGRAVKALLAQTYEDWELVLVDNYGDGYAFEDPRIRCFAYTEERGAAAARNFGLGEASKPLLCFWDDDDYPAPEYMERFARVFNDPEVKMARCKMRTGMRESFDFGTPQVVVRRQLATPTWLSMPRHDKYYWTGVMDAAGIAPGGPGFRDIDETLVHAMHDAKGGLRAPDAML